METFVARKFGKEAVSSQVGQYQRLPDMNGIVPDSYLICLKPNWENFSFEGSEIVHLTIKNDVRELVLNATDLTIGKIIWIEDVTENRQEPMSIQLVDNELLKIIFEPTLNPGQGSLRINFLGQIFTKAYKGVYQTKHHSEQEMYKIASSFEAIDAHRCFPCWYYTHKGPAIRATFSLCLILHKELLAISNMPVKVTYAHRSNPQLHVVEFMPTPPISPHLLCFCIGQFHVLSGHIFDNLLPCHVYTEKGKRRLGRLSLDLAMKILPFYSNYFGINFPSAKLDLIGLPQTSSSVMGNHWGLVTMNESNLYVDDQTSRPFVESLSLSVAQQLAQSWFGNLVSIQWFNYAWVPQAFATFMGYLAIDQLSPELEIVWSQFINDCFFKAMELDCNRFCHPIERSVNTIGDIGELIDDPIVSLKGAALLRMLYDSMGDEQFRKGINLYLSRHQFKTATSADLWQAFNEASDKPIDGIMNTWTKQAGYPIIKVSTRQEGNYRLFTLTQEKFQGDFVGGQRGGGGINSIMNREPLWTIPLTFSSAAKPDLLKVVMDKKTITVSILIGKAHWVYINPGLNGFFRVHYGPKCFTQFLSAVRQKQLPVLERMGLLSDLFAMNMAGMCSTVEILSVLEAYVEETNYAVWRLIASIIQKLDLLLESTEFHGKFLSYARFIFSHIQEKTKWEAMENEGHLAIMRRGVILSMMIFLNEEGALAEARKRYELHAKGELTIPPDLRIPIYSAVVADGDEETVKAFFRMYHESESLEEKDRIAKFVFGCVKRPDKLKMILDFSISDAVLSRHHAQHTVQIMMAVSMGSKIGRKMVWTFLKENWTLFRQRCAGGASFSSAGPLLNSLVKCVTENFVTEEKAVEVAEFFKDRHFTGLDMRTVLLACENIRGNEAWLKRDSNFIQDYISSYT